MKIPKNSQATKQLLLLILAQKICRLVLANTKKVIIMDYEKAENEIIGIASKSSNVLEKVVDYLYKNFNHYSWVGIYLVE